MCGPKRASQQPPEMWENHSVCDILSVTAGAVVMVGGSVPGEEWRLLHSKKRRANDIIRGRK